MKLRIVTLMGQVGQVDLRVSSNDKEKGGFKH